MCWRFSEVYHQDLIIMPRDETLRVYVLHSIGLHFRYMRELLMWEKPGLKGPILKQAAWECTCDTQLRLYVWEQLEHTRGKLIVYTCNSTEWGLDGGECFIILITLQAIESRERAFRPSITMYGIGEELFSRSWFYTQLSLIQKKELRLSP